MRGDVAELAPELLEIVRNTAVERREAVAERLGSMAPRRLALLSRFLRYVAVDTRAEESGRRPSSAGQDELLRLLAAELGALGLQDVRVEAGVVLRATLPGISAPLDTSGDDGPASPPTLVFVAHVDTAPETAGGPVRARLHPAYDGGDVTIEAARGVRIPASENPHLEAYRGHDLLTSDGTTLLGADNKAGVAAIVQTLALLQADPSQPRPTVIVLFTSDEELGIGAEAVDFGSLRADVAYTVDGDGFGFVDEECFCIDQLAIEIAAAGAQVNAIQVAAALIDGWDANQRPESATGRVGYVDFSDSRGDAQRVRIAGTIVDFEVEGLTRRAAALRDHCRDVERRFPGAAIALVRALRCRNMRYVLKKHPYVVGRALEAGQRIGLELVPRAARYGVDAASFCFRGIPAANLFCGFHHFHRVTEHISLDVMERCVDLLVSLVRVWAVPFPVSPTSARKRRASAQGVAR